jgi:hypothetical protein
MVGPVPSAGCAYSRERGGHCGRCCAGAAKAACALAAPWMRCHGCASRRGRAQCESSRRVRSAFELLSLSCAGVTGGCPQVINFLHEDTKELMKAGKLWENFLHMRNLANPKRHLNVFMTAEGARCASARQPWVPRWRAESHRAAVAHRRVYCTGAGQLGSVLVQCSRAEDVKRDKWGYSRGCS